MHRHDLLLAVLDHGGERAVQRHTLEGLRAHKGTFQGLENQLKTQRGRAIACKGSVLVKAMISAG